jgi:hypothetical protein
MEGERFADALWYKRLHIRHPDLVHRAVSEELTVLVPQTTSLLSTAISKTDYGARRGCPPAGSLTLLSRFCALCRSPGSLDANARVRTRRRRARWRRQCAHAGTSHANGSAVAQPTAAVALNPDSPALSRSAPLHFVQSTTSSARRPCAASL